VYGLFLGRGAAEAVEGEDEGNGWSDAAGGLWAEWGGGEWVGDWGWGEEGLIGLVWLREGEGEGEGEREKEKKRKHERDV